VKEITATVFDCPHTHIYTCSYTLIHIRIQIKRNAVNNIKVAKLEKKKVLLWPKRDTLGPSSVLAVTNEVLGTWNVGVNIGPKVYRLDYDVAMKFVKCELQILRSFQTK